MLKFFRPVNRKFLLPAGIMIVVIGMAAYVYFPRNLLSAAKLNDVKVDEIKSVTITVAAGSELNEEDIHRHVTLYDSHSIKKVLSLLEDKYARKKLNQSYSHDPFIGMFISIHYVDSRTSENKITTIDMITSSQIMMNSSHYVLYGKGIDLPHVRDVLKEFQ